MPTKETINPAGAPPALSSYSPALRVPLAGAEMILTSGQLALEDDGSFHAHGDAGAQAARCFAQIEQLLLTAGASLTDVVKTTVYLIDFADLAAVRAARDALAWDVPPATTVVQVAALVDPVVRVEIEAVAVRRAR